MFVPIDELVEGLIGGRAEKKVERIIAVLVFIKAHYVIDSGWVSILPYVVVIRNLSHCLDVACNNLCKVVRFLIVSMLVLAGSTMRFILEVKMIVVSSSPSSVGGLRYTF